ncbi:3-isopropylmalate dehydratase small subunit [Pseudothermotoga thermarum]|uniref:3-isopropylmalate dehydratase small subunit n=1 Tax=Pseudothermotoga thermarum TaxID=119394 RepID=UPI001B7F8669|nr:3-isopropylmalate dehydratase small subunit [Pseudothermotoga thermarum]
MYEGKTLKYGDNIDTDVIIPARYLNTTDPTELARHCMEDLDPDFKVKVKEKTILVVGENFGCGSSREHAPIAIKASGVKCIIAKSFARIFYRNAINIGLAIVELPEAVEKINEGDWVKVDLSNGLVENATTGEVFKIKPFPLLIQEIIKRGGLLNFAMAKARGEIK